MLKKIRHYYGDTVRRLFVLAALVMVVTLPFFIKEIPEPLFISLLAILLVGMAAGLTSPLHGWTAIANVFIAAGGVLVFEWHAVDWYGSQETAGKYFWTNQLLAIIFLLALYFSLKTSRRIGSSRPKEVFERNEEPSFLDTPPRDDGGDI